MVPFADKRSWTEIEAFVDGYEEAQVRDGRAELTHFLPPHDHPHFRLVLLELIRVELEYRWQRGEPSTAAAYRERFPKLFDDPLMADEVAYEVERLGRRDLDESAFPEVGDDFLGFHLVAELGRGAFGRVYLAEQESLANRTVALKVAKSLFAESQTLAQLQHTHIVPIHSVHRQPPFQAVCMPYFGGATLAETLAQLRNHETLPASGKNLVSTLRTAPTVGGNGQPRAGVLDVVPRSAAPPPAEVGPTPWSRLAHSSYVDAVLWIVARLAEGLEHAHARGVLHRDLKPANILLTDEGQPMLLDFNLSSATRRGVSSAPAEVGGTLPYMAPEQIAALDGEAAVVDARSDVYSLGVVLYELLSLRQPFPLPANSRTDALEQMRLDRWQGAPRLRAVNAAVSLAVESVVRHALEPDPARRYQSAAELHEDLDRHLKHLPLMHADEPSWRERMSKWVRRHPRLASSTSLAVVVVALSVVAAAALSLNQRRLARLEAVDQFRQFEAGLRPALYRLNSALSIDRRQRQAGVERGRKLLEAYGVADGGTWDAQPAVSNLPFDQRRRLQDELGELLLLIAAATAGDDRATLESALEWNRLAQRWFTAAETPRAIWTQRAEWLRRLGRASEAAEAHLRAARASPRHALDHFLLGRDEALHGRFREALSSLDAAVRLDPQSLWAWFVLGRSYDELSLNVDAARCYTVCIALWPDFAGAHYNRGLAWLREGDHRSARADFDQALKLQADLVEARIDRGLTRLALADLAGAEDDFSRALEMGADNPRVLLIRAKVRRMRGDDDGARHDLVAGLAAEPIDEVGWVARGLARLPTDPAAALADIEQALRLDARYLTGLQNKAAILAELPGRVTEAIETLDLAVAVYPDSVPARAGRGVLLARLGRREAALDDARESLLRDTRPPTLYQVACIYALSSQGSPENRQEALRLLGSALAQGYGRELVATDGDLDPLRGDDEFRRLLKNAEAEESK